MQQRNSRSKTRNGRIYRLWLKGERQRDWKQWGVQKVVDLLLLMRQSRGIELHFKCSKTHDKDSANVFIYFTPVWLFVCSSSASISSFFSICPLLILKKNQLHGLKDEKKSYFEARYICPHQIKKLVGPMLVNYIVYYIYFKWL